MANTDVVSSTITRISNTKTTASMSKEVLVATLASPAADKEDDGEKNRKKSRRW